MKGICVITFQFPPLGGVGTKRMSKFSKYLSLSDYKVDVITVEYGFQMHNTWQEDVEKKGIIIHRINSGCPISLVMRKYPKTFMWRIADFLRSGVRFTLQKTIYYIDWAQIWGKYLLPFARDLIERNGIVNVLATGAPFTVNYWAARLKNLCPQINLINDFRDMWNDDPLRRYPTPWHRSRAVGMEQFTLDHSDWVVATTDQQVELLRRRCRNPDVRFALIPNGYDPEDQNPRGQDKIPDVFSLVYTGNIGNGREIGFMNFLKAVSKAGRQNPDFAKSFRLDLYGMITEKYYMSEPELVKSGSVSYHGVVSPEEAYRAVANGFMSLLINADIVPYAGSSKIYEYFSLGRPIYTITPPGWIDNIITGYNLGCSLRTNDIDGMVQQLIKWFETWKNDPGYRVIPSGELLRRFSYPEIVKKLETCFV